MVSLPPRSWSTIGCQYSPQSLSSAAMRIHHELPPRSWSTTTAIRCQHDRGSAIFVMTSQHDTESAILDPPLQSLIHDPQVVLHDVATAVALDLRTVGQSNSGEEVKAVTCIDLDMNFFNMITMGKSVTCMWLDKNFVNMIMMEKRKEKLEREAPSVLCPPDLLDL